MSRRAQPTAETASLLNPRRHLMLAGIVLLALAVRGVYLWGQAANNPLCEHPIMDGLVHHQWAEQIASGEGMGEVPYFRAPLYYYLLGFLYKLFGSSVLLGRVAGCVLGAFTCYLIARLGIALAGFTTGLIAGLLAALYWPFVYFDAELLTVGLEVFLDVAFLLTLLIAMQRGSWLLFLAAGVLWGLSAITRPTVLTFVPGFLLWLWLATPKDGRLKRWAAATIVTGLGGAAVVLPITIRNYVVGHELALVATNGGLNFYIGNNPQANGYTAIVPGTRPDWWGGYEDTHRIVQAQLGRKPTESEVSSYWADKAWEWIRSEPGAWIKLMARKFGLFWTPVELPNNQPIRFFAKLSGISVIFWIGFPIAACLGLAGLAFIRAIWRAWLLPILFSSIYIVTVVLFFCNGRYRLPIVPVLLVATAFGITRLVAEIKAGHLGRPMAYIFAALIMAAALAANPTVTRASFQRGATGEGHFILASHFRQATDTQPPDNDKALEHFEQAVELRPKDGDLRLQFADFLFSLQRRQEAEQQFAEAVKVWPGYAKARFRYGVFLNATRRTAQAVDQFRKAVELQPTYTEARQALGSALARLGQAAEALEHLRQALALNPESVPARLSLGTALIKLGQHEAALAELDEILKREPANTTALHYRGNALAKLGRFEPAIESFRQALRLNPVLPGASYALANALQIVGRDAQALQVYRDALTTSPSDMRLVNGLAWLLATTPDDKLRNGTEAVQLAEQAQRLAGRAHPQILDALAAAYAEVGRFDEALAKTKLAVKLARSANRADLALQIEARQRLYEQQRPYRAAPSAADGD